MIDLLLGGMFELLRQLFTPRREMLFEQFGGSTARLLLERLHLLRVFAGHDTGRQVAEPGRQGAYLGPFRSELPGRISVACHMVQHRDAEGVVGVVEQQVLAGHKKRIVFGHRSHVVAAAHDALAQQVVVQQGLFEQFPHRKVVSVMMEVEVERFVVLLQGPEIEMALQVVDAQPLQSHFGIEKVVGTVLHEGAVGLPAHRVVQVVEQYAVARVHGPAGGKALRLPEAVFQPEADPGFRLRIEG